MKISTAKTISVVTPTYNRRDFLQTAVESIQSQTYPVSEIIIVDDGSTDGTPSVVRQMAERDPRIKLVEQERGGANRARNAGIELATGNWIAFLDSDDYWLPEKLSLQVQALDNSAEAIASFTGLRNVGGRRESVFRPPLDPSLSLLRSTNCLSSTSTALVEKIVLDKVGRFDVNLRSCQDWDLWFRLRKEGPFAVVPDPLTHFVEHNMERITTNDDAVFAGHAAIFKTLLAELPPSERRKFKPGHDLVLANLYLNRNNPRAAAKLAIASLVARPSKWGTRLAIEASLQLIKGPARRST